MERSYVATCTCPEPYETSTCFAARLITLYLVDKGALEMKLAELQREQRSGERMANLGDCWKVEGWGGAGFPHEGGWVNVPIILPSRSVLPQFALFFPRHAITWQETRIT